MQEMLCGFDQPPDRGVVGIDEGGGQKPFWVSVVVGDIGVDRATDQVGRIGLFW